MAITVNWVDEAAGEIKQDYWQFPLAILKVTWAGDVVIASDWVDDIVDPAIFLPVNSAWLDPEIKVVLKVLKQGSLFRQKVWVALSQVPLGRTITYAGLAVMVGSAARPVANACRDNPFSYIVPCHRVLASKGLGGYCGQIAGEFLQLKKQLLLLEGVV